MNNRDSSLLEKNIISQSDFERDLISRLTISQDRFVLEKLSYNILDAIDNAHISLKNYVFTNEIKLLELRSRIIDATMNLKNSIREWRSKYLIVSPCDGKVEINNMIMSGSFVSFQDVIFTVKPNNSKWQANLYVDQNNSAKIKNGQKVIVKLSMFPSSEFGHIVGKVKYISEIPIYQNYNNQSKALILVKVELPDVLVSSSKLKLEPINELSGVGEIITEEKRLIERILNF
jgi:multidrug resistance efflux pump